MFSAQSFAWCSVGFAVLAAALWAASALVNLPVVRSTYDGIDGLEPFQAAIKKAARLNMLAAASAAISALCQAVSLAL
ncbi:hypothetical protein [Bradyrhizobium guangdongense]|nr:hypothetical protein [Bradyrhizobium guangdongense]GGI33039.1 hypothetical protein GCM10010987_72400 [Bradyrhizobium guangdongense]